MNKVVMCAALLTLPLCAKVRAEDAAVIQYRGGGNYSLVERTDLRRYDNGRYTGLVSREVRSFITAAVPPAELSPQVRPTDTFYDGDFYIKEETMRNRRKAANSINMSIPSMFRITSGGDLVMMEDNGYPSFRSFPAYSTNAVQVGDRWRADAVRAVDPMGDGLITRMPINVEYTYIGDDVWNGEDVFVLSAKWATRYGGTYGGGAYGGRVDRDGDPSLLRAEGSHSATMYVSRRTGAALVVHDKVDETFIYDRGDAVAFKGTISLFTEYPSAVDRGNLIPALQRAGIASAAEAAAIATVKGTGGSGGKATGGGGADGKGGKDGVVGKGKNGSTDVGGKKGHDDEVTSERSGLPSDFAAPRDTSLDKIVSRRPEDDVSRRATTAAVASAAIASTKDGGGKQPNIKVEDTDSGVRLTIEDLRFLPDSAQLLPAERQRVATIASVLREVPKSMFLVEGHTASTGNPKGEQNLSEERARAIAQALAGYGIDAGRFICKGSGGRKPIASNATPQGKAQNRRVEITILE